MPSAENVNMKIKLLWRHVSTINTQNSNTYNISSCKWRFLNYNLVKKSINAQFNFLKNLLCFLTWELSNDIFIKLKFVIKFKSTERKNNKT